jgi:hypothetical protein
MSIAPKTSTNALGINKQQQDHSANVWCPCKVD